MGAPSWDGRPSPSPEEMMGKFMVAVIVIIVLIILYVLMIRLFARWVVGGFEVQSLGRSGRRLDFAPTQDPEPVHSGLEASVIHALPLVTFKQEDFLEGLECAVCLCELEDGETARLLPNCNHGFHVDCIDMWFHSHATCPLCRITVEPDSGDSNSETQSEDADADADSDSDSDSDSSISTGSNGHSTSSCPQSPCSSTYAPPNTSLQSSLIIDIPTKLTNEFTEEGRESPIDRMSARFRSLTRLLSSGKTEIASSLSSVDVEQGEGGKDQS